MGRGIQRGQSCAWLNWIAPAGNKMKTVARKTVPMATEAGFIASPRWAGEHDEFDSGRPTRGFPENPGRLVLIEHENVALLDALGAEIREAATDEGSGGSTTTVRGRNREMVDVSAASIVPAEHSPDEAVGIECDEAQPGIPLQKLLEAGGGVRIAQTHTLRGLPERSKGLVVRQDHFANLQCERLHR